MSDLSETSVIDKKKLTSTSINPSSDSGNFFMNVVYQLLFLIVFIITGGAMLWSAKIAQTNLIPTDLYCEPFANSTPSNSSGSTEVNIDVLKIKNQDGTSTIKSTKLEFPSEKNMYTIRDGYLGSIRKWVDGKDSNSFSLYQGTVCTKMAVNYATMISGFYNMLNQNCSESTIIFLMPMLIPFILFFAGLINWFYGYILWLTQIYLIFSEDKGCYEEDELVKTKTNGPDGKPIVSYEQTKIKRKLWVYENGATKGWWSTFLYILYTVLAFLSLSTIGTLVILYYLIRVSSTILFLPLFFNAYIKPKDGSSETEKTPYTFRTALFNIFKYKLNIIMYSVSYAIMRAAYSSNGTLGIFITLVGCLIVFSFYPKVYKQETDNPNLTEGMVSTEQTIKKCAEKIFSKISLQQCNEEIPIPAAIASATATPVTVNGYLDSARQGSGSPISGKPVVFGKPVQPTPGTVSPPVPTAIGTVSPPVPTAIGTVSPPVPTAIGTVSPPVPTAIGTVSPEVSTTNYKGGRSMKNLSKRKN